MRTRTPASAVKKAALVGALFASLALTACEIPGKDDKKAEASKSASAEPSAAPSEEASDAPAESPKPKDPTATKRPTSAAPTKQGTAGPRVLVSAARTGGYERLTEDMLSVPVDPGDIGEGMNVVLAAYGKTPTGDREVLFEGVSGLTAMDGKRFEHMIRGMIEYVNLDGGSVPEGAAMKSYDPGPLGGTLECMPAQDAYPAAICGWADKNTVAVAYFDKLSADAAAKKLVEMRSDLEK
ncbi:hypothetical protein [Yinghuangia soli]|uniref:Lipoprotein n=1 Tax=Yinghuangia soli TaxID=2908204 RepID=A0AA41Q928_9ACTN|nr:hypothetical protein [Yinghuangia soli]MCF2533512.1 hypothetical protein [Yinghuangia soli]